MGKKSKRPSAGSSTARGNSGVKFYPFVSVCTVTFNRRPFWKTAFEIFKHQDYPKNRMEWVIVDDGTDKIGDLVRDAKIPQIKYVEIEKKMALGAKRNLSHTHCKGSIIVYMDDDDYYPPDRVSHAVERLTSRPTAMCAGSSRCSAILARGWVWPVSSMRMVAKNIRTTPITSPTTFAALVLDLWQASAGLVTIMGGVTPTPTNWIATLKTVVSGSNMCLKMQLTINRSAWIIRIGP